MGAEEPVGVLVGSGVGIKFWMTHSWTATASGQVAGQEVLILCREVSLLSDWPPSALSSRDN